MKYCIRCGNLVDGAPYCTQCGAKTDQPQTDVYGIAPSDYNVNPYADPQTNPYAYTSQLSRATYTGPDYDLRGFRLLPKRLLDSGRRGR